MVNALLDAQYDTARQLPDGDPAPYFARFARESERARAALGGTLDRRYGPHPRETLDFFPARAAGAPLVVWVHGGYWRRMSKNEASYVAPPLVGAGAAVAVVNYPLAPEATIDEIVRSVRAAFAYTREHTAELNADGERLTVAGHSVGAQLAAMLAATAEVRGLFALSGLYDLEPLRHTHVNDTIAMDAQAATRNSPLYTPPLGDPRLVIAAGGLEQQAWHNQQRAYVQAWTGWGHAAAVLDASERDHFSIALALADAASPEAAALRGLAGL